jgi:hypothetical protein
MKNRLIALSLMLLMALSAVLAPALADETWTCLNCGQAGSTGNFCSNCASPRPAAAWDCPNCGQTGNTGNYCSNCASPRPSGTPNTPAAVSNIVWY